MPFYGGDKKTKENTVSGVNQGEEGNCYIVAPVAAFSLTADPTKSAEEVAKAVGIGMGGTSNRAFREMGLYAFNKNQSYQTKWRELITKSVEGNYPACLGISWESVKSKKTGNHVVYVIGFEGTTVYARDQQNKHVLISIDMKKPWRSAQFTVGKSISRTCTLSWVGIGCPTRKDASDLLTK